ncbi:MAG: DUF1629 domain-containing protein [Stappiaceae bacterium]
MPFHVDVSFKAKYSPRIAAENKAMSDLHKQMIQHRDEILFGSKPYGLRVDPESVPKTAQVISSHKKLYDFVPADFRNLVTRAFIDKVEEMEPSVHQFFPVELRMKSNELSDRDYWFLNVCHRTDAIDANKSVLIQTGDAYFKHGVGLGVEPKLVFRKAEIEGKCMWIDRRFTAGFFVSDELMEFMEEEKMKELDKWEVFAE